MSADGNIVAIGANGNDGVNFEDKAGHVRVYKFHSDGWVQMGADIDGEKRMEYTGSSVSMSSDGSIIAIGATGNYDN